MRRFVAVLLSALALVFAFPSRAHAADLALAWDAVSDPDLSGYILEYGTSAAPYATRVYVGNQTSWTFIGLVDGTTYTFRVRAYNSEGVESDPSNEVSATVGTSSTSPTATSTTTSTQSSCTTPDPFASIGGGTCYNGGWLPPGMAPPSGTTTTTTTTTAPAATTTTTSTQAGCTTPDPFAAMGGGTCYNGGWLPPGMAPPAGATTTTSPSAPTYTVTTTPPPSQVGCTTPDPFAAMGGGTCYNGGWLPPGMAPPAGSTATTTYTTSAPAPSGPATCTTPDPFASIQGLVGVCVNGGWVPISGQDGTARLSVTGAWQIVGDNGITYLPVTALDPSLDGVRVFFAGVVQGTVNGETIIQILKITAL